MPQELAGIVKLRGTPPLKIGPPNGPFGLRVSATRHGVIGTKRKPEPDPPVELKFAVTFLGADIVTDVGFAEPVASPLQLAKVNPEFAAADNCTEVPEL